MILLNYFYQRHIFKRLVIAFSFTLFGLFFIYALLDYSLRMQDFIDGKSMNFALIGTYYGFEFIKRSEFLLPLSLLLASIFCLTRLNASRELVALLSSGISMKKILRPFWLTACCIFCFQLVNQELLLPKARYAIDDIKNTYVRNVRKLSATEPFRLLYLKDGSKLFYQSFDKTTQTYFDVVWLRSLGEIWRIKQMSSKAENSFQGKFVDIIRRNEVENLEKKETHSLLNLKGLSLEDAAFHIVQTPVESLPLTHLFKELIKPPTKRIYTPSELWTEILSKTLSSAMAFLVLFVAVPISTIYQRRIPVFLIYSLSLFGFFAFIAFVDSLKILSVNQVVSPFITMGLSYSLAFFFFWNKYRKNTMVSKSSPAFSFSQTGPWKFPALGISHLIGVIAFISLFYPPLKDLWHKIDLWCFHTLNDTLSWGKACQNFWAFANSRTHDWIEDLIFGVFFYFYIKNPNGKSTKTKLLECVGILLMTALAIFCINKLIFRDICRVRRLSPTLVIDPCWRLSNLIKWTEVRDSAKYCFPADHASTAMIFGCLLAPLTKGILRWSVIFYCAFLCLPRLVVGAHWLSDVIVGGGSIALSVYAWFYFTPLHQRIVQIKMKEKPSPS